MEMQCIFYALGTGFLNIYMDFKLQGVKVVPKCIY
jgi:hypothetical protein